VDLVGTVSFQSVRFLSGAWVEDCPFEYVQELAKDFEPYLSVEPAGPLLQLFLDKLFRRKARNDRFSSRLESKGGETRSLCDASVSRSPDVRETLNSVGSCRDSAWCWYRFFGIWALRHASFGISDSDGVRRESAGRSERPANDSADFHAGQRLFTGAG